MAPSNEQRQLTEDEQRLQGKTFAALVSGGIAGFFGMFGAEAWARNKLRSFDFQVQDLTRTDILNRTGTGGIGAGIDSAGIELRHRLELINAGEHKFARFIYNIGGKGTFAIGVGAIIGLLVAIPVWLFSFRRNKYDTQQPTLNNAAINQRAASQPLPAPEIPATEKQFAKDIAPKPIDPASIAQPVETETEVRR